MLKAHYKDYKKNEYGNYPLRIYDLMKDKPENFSLLSKVLNYLPMIAGVAGTVMDDEDSGANEAGLGLLALGLLGKGKGARLRKFMSKLDDVKDATFNYRKLAKNLGKEVAYRNKLNQKIYDLSDNLSMEETGYAYKVSGLLQKTSVPNKDLQNIQKYAKHLR